MNRQLLSRLSAALIASGSLSVVTAPAADDAPNVLRSEPAWDHSESASRVTLAALAQAIRLPDSATPPDTFTGRERPAISLVSLLIEIGEATETTLPQPIEAPVTLAPNRTVSLEPAYAARSTAPQTSATPIANPAKDLPSAITPVNEPGDSSANPLRESATPTVPPPSNPPTSSRWKNPLR